MNDINHQHHPNQKFAVQIGDSNLTYRAAQIADPVPTGRQIVEAAGVRPEEEHMAFMVLPNGLLEELRPDETVDLRGKGVERFLVFKTDRSFRFQLDGRIFDWGAAQISGLALKKLADVDPVAYGVWQEVRGGEDRLIRDTDMADLSTKGVEHFFTGIIQTTEG